MTKHAITVPVPIYMGDLVVCDVSAHPVYEITDSLHSHLLSSVVVHVCRGAYVLSWICPNLRGHKDRGRGMLIGTWHLPNYSHAEPETSE